jgi:hypothetical protein
MSTFWANTMRQNYFTTIWASNAVSGLEGIMRTTAITST